MVGRPLFVRNHEADDLDSPGAARNGGVRRGFAARPGWMPRFATGGNRSRRVVATVAGTCVCGVAAGLSLAFLVPHGQTDHPAAASGVQPAVTGLPGKPVSQAVAPVPSHSPARPGQPTAKPAGRVTGVTADGIARSALTPAASAKGAVAAWYKGSGGRYLVLVTRQSAAAMQAGGVKLYAAARDSCASLASSIRSAQAGPPIPDSAMQAAYGKALGTLSAAAGGCLRAVSVRPDGEDNQISVNRSGLSRAIAGLSAGSAQLYRATAQIRAAHS